MANAIERWFDRRQQLAPFRDLSQIQESFDRLFNEFMNLRRTDGLQEIGFSPSCEIAEEANRYVLLFDLPGVKKDHVKVEVDNDQITVQAERMDERKSDSKKTFLSEVYYGSFARTFTLPMPIDEKKIDAKFENGVLTIMVPKSEGTKTKQIPVH
jgi:HSP20 family protein